MIRRQDLQTNPRIDAESIYKFILEIEYRAETRRKDTSSCKFIRSRKNNNKYHD